MFLLDTDTLSLVHSDDPTVLQRRRDLPSREIAITVVTRIEMLRGRFDYVLKAADGDQLLRAQEWLRRTDAKLSQISIVPFDAAAAAEFDRLRANKGLRKIGRADLLIAGCASRIIGLCARNESLPR